MWEVSFKIDEVRCAMTMGPYCIAHIVPPRFLSLFVYKIHLIFPYYPSIYHNIHLILTQGCIYRYLSYVFQLLVFFVKNEI